MTQQQHAFSTHVHEHTHTRPPSNMYAIIRFFFSFYILHNFCTTVMDALQPHSRTFMHTHFQFQWLLFLLLLPVLLLLLPLRLRLPLLLLLFLKLHCALRFWFLCNFTFHTPHAVFGVSFYAFTFNSFLVVYCACLFFGKNYARHTGQTHNTRKN